MNRTGWVVVLVAMTLLFIMAMWNLDICVSGMVSFGENAILSNGFWLSDPVQYYHVSLYSMTVIFFLLVCVAVHHMRIDRGEK